MKKQAVEKAIHYLCDHLCEEFSLAEAAAYVGYSPFHFAREFKEATGQTVMEYVRKQRIRTAAEEIKSGANVCETALKYGFETHAGFTRAFSAVFGCSPRQYANHAGKLYRKGTIDMENASITIRPVRLEDVQTLWEHVYSAMTPREITEEKIRPAMERLEKEEGIELAAEVDGVVRMTLPMIKPFWIPFGVLFDNNYTLTNGAEDALMRMLLEEMKAWCRNHEISTLISPQVTGSENVKAFLYHGFTEAWQAGGWSYLMTTV